MHSDENQASSFERVETSNKNFLKIDHTIPVNFIYVSGHVHSFPEANRRAFKVDYRPAGLQLTRTLPMEPIGIQSIHSDENQASFFEWVEISNKNFIKIDHTIPVNFIYVSGHAHSFTEANRRAFKMGYRPAGLQLTRTFAVEPIDIQSTHSDENQASSFRRVETLNKNFIKINHTIPAKFIYVSGHVHSSLEAQGRAFKVDYRPAGLQLTRTLLVEPICIEHALG